mgnify:FL=1
MEYEEPNIEEVETLQTDVVFDEPVVSDEPSDIEIYSEFTSETLISETVSETVETSVTTYNDSENIQRIADNTDFGVGFLQAFTVAFVMIALYKFLKIFF